MVRLGRALNECKGKAEADTVAEVIVSQVCLLNTPWYRVTSRLRMAQHSALVAPMTVPSTAAKQACVWLCRSIMVC